MKINFLLLASLFFLLPLTMNAQVSGDDIVKLLYRDLTIEPYKSIWKEAKMYQHQCGYSIEGRHLDSKVPVITAVIFRNGTESRNCKKCMPFGLKPNMSFEKAEKQIYKSKGSNDNYRSQVQNTYIAIVTRPNLYENKWSVKVTLQDGIANQRKSEAREHIKKNRTFSDSKTKQFYYENRRFNNFVYVGDIEYGECVSGNCSNGNGTMKWDDGREFTGSFKNGVPQSGTIKFYHFWHTECEIKNADFADGMLHTSKAVFTSGDGMSGIISYEYGIPVSTDGLKKNDMTYSGELNKDQYSPLGQGRIMLTDGRRIETYFRSWKFDDVNIYYTDGSQYNGLISPDFKRHGNGWMIFKEAGYSVQSDFVDDVPVGKSTIRFSGRDIKQFGVFSMQDGLQGEVLTTKPYPLGEVQIKGDFSKNKPTGIHIVTDKESGWEYMKSEYKDGALISGDELYSLDNIDTLAVWLLKAYYKENFDEQAQNAFKTYREQGFELVTKKIYINDTSVVSFDWNFNKDENGQQFTDTIHVSMLGVMDPAGRAPDLKVKLIFKKAGSDKDSKIPLNFNRSDSQFEQYTKEFFFFDDMMEASNFTVELSRKDGMNFSRIGYPVYVLVVKTKKTRADYSYYSR